MRRPPLAHAALSSIALAFQNCSPPRPGDPSHAVANRQMKRFGGIVAPQSFTVACDTSHGASPAQVGRIPGSHLIFGGDEWWFYGPRLFAGDRVIHEKIPYDYFVKETKFAGPTCFQRGDNFYYKQDGTLFAKQRSTCIRYRADAAREMAFLDAEGIDLHRGDLAAARLWRGGSGGGFGGGCHGSFLRGFLPGREWAPAGKLDLQIRLQC